MGFFSSVKKTHLRASGQADAVWELKSGADIDLTRISEADRSKISDQVFDALERIEPNWGKEDFALVFIIFCGSSFVESKVTTKLFHDVAFSYISKNRSKFNGSILQGCLQTLGEWSGAHNF